MLMTINALGQSVSKDSLLQALRVTNIPSEKVTILNQLASVFLEEDPVRAENYASQALFIAESIQDQQGRSEAYYHLGHLALNKKEYEKSMDYLKMAEEGFIAEKDDVGLARVYLILNDAYKRKLEYEKALKMLFQAMETFKKEGQSKELGATYNAIGGNFYDQGNFEKAFEYFSNSLEIYTDLGETVYIGSLYNNIGEIYRFKKDYAKAIEYYRKALRIFLEFNEEVRLSMIYTNLGNTYLEKGQIDSADYFLNLGLELSDYTKDINRMSSVRISIGQLHMARGDLERAQENINQGFDLAVQGSNNSNTALAAKLLSDLYTLENNYEQAYKYFVRFRNIDDSLHNIKNLEKITQMEMNLLFELENEVRKIQVQRTNLRYFTIAFVLVSIIVLVILLYGRQRIKANQNRTLGENLQMEKEQLQEEIEFKNRELATNVMFLVKKNELINFISEKLLRVKSDFKPSVRKAVDEILIDLQSNVDQNIWNVFEERFREVHSEFYDNLVKQFPHLTDNDKKLCAFIRLNMNTKEIAAITHQNPNSIEVARTRLRKKLNISNTDISLNSFLSQV